MAEQKEIKRKLFDKLKEYHPNKDFVLGVMSNAKHDDDRQAIMNYMDEGTDVSVENIILLSLHLNNERKNKK